MLAVLAKVIIGWLTHKAGVDKFTRKKENPMANTTWTCTHGHKNISGNKCCGQCGEARTATPAPEPDPIDQMADGEEDQTVIFPDGSTLSPIPDGRTVYTDRDGNKFWVAEDGEFTPIGPQRPPARTTPRRTQHTPAAHKPGFWHNVKHALDELDKKTGL